MLAFAKLINYVLASVVFGILRVATADMGLAAWAVSLVVAIVVFYILRAILVSPLVRSATKKASARIIEHIADGGDFDGAVRIAKKLGLSTGEAKQVAISHHDALVKELTERIIREAKHRYEKRKDKEETKRYLREKGIPEEDINKAVEMTREIKERLSIKLFVNYSAVGSRLEEWQQQAEAFTAAGADILEPNFCCPNLDTSDPLSEKKSDHGGASIGENPDVCARIMESHKKVSDLPIVPKIIPGDRHTLISVARILQECKPRNFLPRKLPDTIFPRNPYFFESQRRPSIPAWSFRPLWAQPQGCAGCCDLRFPAELPV